jgi:hypothetical protein
LKNSLPISKLLSIILLTLFLSACGQKKEHAIDFYYWRSNFKVTQVEQKLVKDLEVKNIYIRLFDVDKKGVQTLPVGTIHQFDASKLTVNYIPTVFITNRSFQGMQLKEVKELAGNVYKLINSIAASGQLKNYSEIQIDCDWTQSTRQNYFYFLEELKKISSKNISATLRLHQVKFKEKEGIPPLDKMVLMCYATENPHEVKENNSILNLDLAKDYLQDLDQYPIKLDVALPIYSWAIITNHLGKIKLVNSFTEEDLKGQPVKAIGNGIYEVLDDFFIENIYLSKGFKIKVESISPELLSQTISFLDQKIKNDFSIVYYHLDEKFIKNYQLKTL